MYVLIEEDSAIFLGIEEVYSLETTDFNILIETIVNRGVDIVFGIVDPFILTLKRRSSRCV